MVLRISFRGAGGGIGPPPSLENSHHSYVQCIYAHIEISPVLMAKLTNKMSLASCYVREMTISLSHSLLVINTHATFGLSLSIICSLPRGTCTCSYVHAPCVYTYMYLMYKNQKIPVCTKWPKYISSEVVGRIWLKYTGVHLCSLRSHQKWFHRS